MTTIEAVFVWLGILSLAASSAGLVYAVVFGRDSMLGKVTAAVWLSFGLITIAIAARYMAVGNLPTAGNYENSLGGTWMILAFTLYVMARRPAERAVGMFTLPLSMILLGVGLMSNPRLEPMVAATKSFWLVVHVFFAWLAFGAYAITAGLAVMYLLKEKNPEDPRYAKFPSLERLDENMFRFLVFGFITDAVMVASGSVWAKELWGSYWSWDPVETWSLVTWLIYGLAIHLKMTMRWQGAKLAWLLIFALLGMIITYFGIDLFVKSSLHMFDALREF